MRNFRTEQAGKMNKDCMAMCCCMHMAYYCCCEMNSCKSRTPGILIMDMELRN